MTHPLIPFVDQERQPDEWLSAAETLSRRVIETDAHTAWQRVCAGEV